MTIDFKGRPDGSTLATVVLVNSGSSVPRFYRHKLAKGVDPWEAYSEVAAAAINYLAARTEPERETPAQSGRPAGRGRVIQFQTALPMK